MDDHADGMRLKNTLSHEVRVTQTSRGCVGCAIVKGDHAPDCGVAQGLFMESLGTVARRRKRWTN